MPMCAITPLWSVILSVSSMCCTCPMCRFFCVCILCHSKDDYEEPSIQGVHLKDLRYAYDTALLSTTPTGLEKLIKYVKGHIDEKGLFLNVKKTKIMDIDKCKKEARIAIDGEEIETFSNFEYLGARIEANRKNTPEIRRRLAIAATRLTKTISFWKGQCKKKKKTESPRDSGIPNCLVWV